MELSPEEKRKLARREYYEEHRNTVLEAQRKQKNERYKNDPEFRERIKAYNKAKYIPKKKPKEVVEKVEKLPRVSSKKLLEKAMEVVGKEKMDEILKLINIKNN
jgi:hypothetical protein